MITDVPGVLAGHWTDVQARTGCTVVLLPEGTVASGEVRGGAPGTREFELLRPERLVAHIDAVVLTGGSAFGLSACDGVVAWCEEQGRGFVTAAARVPIVVGAVLYDLAVGDASVRPGREQGYAACATASSGVLPLGAVGAGTGATIGKWRGRDSTRPGGIGSATRRDGELIVSALVAVNAFGDLLGPGDGEPPLPPRPTEVLAGEVANVVGGENTTIGVIVTNARLDKVGCLLVAQSGHDGLARALEPAHATLDGDAVIACATGSLDQLDELDDGPSIDRIRVLAARAFAAAIRSAVNEPSDTTPATPG